jgi:lysozyme family protein
LCLFFSEFYSNAYESLDEREARLEKEKKMRRRIKEKKKKRKSY